jgi:hypothetical protein
MFVHVTDVKYLRGYQLQLTFNNGVVGIVDLEPELYGEIFEPLRDPELFQQVYLTSRTIEWPNGADFAPEFLLDLMKSSLKQEQSAREPMQLTTGKP